MAAKKKTTKKQAAKQTSKKTEKQEKPEDLEVVEDRVVRAPRAVERRRVVMRFARLSPVGFGIGWGIIGALMTALITVGAMFGYFDMTASLLLDVYGYFGYSISTLGILLGAIYSFVDFFIASALFAAIYNALS
jgi:hypothetical protein